MIVNLNEYKQNRQEVNSMSDYIKALESDAGIRLVNPENYIDQNGKFNNFLMQRDLQVFHEIAGENEDNMEEKLEIMKKKTGISAKSILAADIPN